jgi:aerobic-type carbon monoxide dehydrogenase small subunit (CoxS/CutS family)
MSDPGRTTTLRVNGAAATTEADPETPLLYVLRNDFGLKGAKYGCGIGVCGACVVRIDGKAEPSCILPIVALGDREVTTVESMAIGRQLDPLQEAFLELQAGQCGYCLSGILLAARALLDESPHPSRDEIRHALDEHICRCGVMERMVRAVELASQRAQ